MITAGLAYNKINDLTPYLLLFLANNKNFGFIISLVYQTEVAKENRVHSVK